MDARSSPTTAMNALMSHAVTVNAFVGNINIDVE
jgi:hypothetical protein